jgi:DHA2 family multidrug resistance protein
VSGPQGVVEGEWRPNFNPWLIAAVVSMAAFLEVLDTSIANVALPHIAGSLAASSSESTWVLTSYLVSNAIVLPAAGWMVSALGRRRYFLICLSVFTLSSILCGMATSLPMLLAGASHPGRGRRRIAAHGAGHPDGFLSRPTSAARRRRCLRSASLRRRR